MPAPEISTSRMVFLLFGTLSAYTRHSGIELVKAPKLS
jgi:hypothetical protein